MSESSANTESIYPVAGLEETIVGIIQHVSHHNRSNGWCVMRVQLKTAGQRQVSVLAKLASAMDGEEITASGVWINDRRQFSTELQFRANTAETRLPAGKGSIRKFLSGGAIKGVGPMTADLLLNTFGESVLDVIENDPDRLLAVSGISLKKRDAIVAAWKETSGIKGLIEFLGRYGVPDEYTIQIFKAYGSDAVDIIVNDPYRLAREVKGVTFAVADGLGFRLGIPSEDQRRVAEGIRQALARYAARGHCAMTRQDLLASASKLLSVNSDLVDNVIDAESSGGHVVLEELGGLACCYPTQLHQAETGTAAHLTRLHGGRPPWRLIDPFTEVPKEESDSGISLSPSQRAAVHQALASKVMVITGGPGVGKTTVVGTIINIIEKHGANITLCAPTGRAARRLTESTGRPASTVHRLLDYSPHTGGFKHGRHNPLKTDFLVVDEASMIDIVLAEKLMSALPDTAALLLVGDVDQLPSVGPGAVLLDIIESTKIPTARLIEIFRQAASSKIIVNSHRINTGQPLELSPAGEAGDFYFVVENNHNKIRDKVVHAATEGARKVFGFDPMNEVQVLTPFNVGPLGSRSLSADIQKVLNPRAGDYIVRNDFTFAVGDRVVQTGVNDYDLGIFNGDTGKIVRVDLPLKAIEVSFDGRLVTIQGAAIDNLMLAYATTIHRSQGSEYQCVVIPVTMQHLLLLERNLLYTAVTRGKKMVILVGEEAAVETAINTVRAARRLTRLAFRLAQL